MEGTSVVYADIDTHKEAHVLCVLDAMGRSDLQRGVSGRQGRIRIARRGDAESYGVAIMEVLRPKRDKRHRGSSKNDAIGATAGKGTPVPKSRDSWVEAARTLVRANVDSCI
jgi:transposase